MRSRRLAPELEVRPGAFGAAYATAQERYPLETGGIVIGWRTKTAVAIDRLVEVPDPNAGHTGFSRKHADAQAALDVVLDEEPADSLLGYVGEWHTHPANLGPSRQDRKQLKSIARRQELPVVLLVLATPRTGDWCTHALISAGWTIIPADLPEELT